MKELVVSAKMKTVLLSVCGALLLYALLGFLILPAVLSNQIPKIAKQELNRNLAIKEIQFNPFSMEFNLKGLQVNNLDDSVFASFDNFYVNVAVLKSIFNLSLTMDQVLLKSLFLSVERNKKGLFNFSDLLESPDDKVKEEKTDGEIFPVTISQFSLLNGKISWTDSFHAKTHQEDIHPLNLEINNFTTLVDKNSDLGFSLMFGSGGQFDWQGKMSLNPLESTGHIKLDKVSFPRVWELFLQNTVKFEILKGSELIEADYQLSDTPDGIQLLVNNAHIDIYEVQLSEKGQKESLMTVPDFKVSGIAVNLLKKNIEIEQVSANDAHFKAWLNADGSINYQSLFATSSENNRATPTNQPVDNDKSEPWLVNVKQLALHNFGLNFTDRSLKTPAEINLSSLDLNVSDLSTDLKSKLPISLAVKINDAGTLNINGHAVPEPFSAEMQIDAENIALKNFQPYIDQSVRLDIISGNINTKTLVSMNLPENAPLNLIVKGNSGVSNLVTRDQISNKDFIKWKQLSLNNMDLDLATNNYKIDSINIDRLYSRVLIRKDRSINVNDIVVESSKDDKKPEKPEQPVKKENNEPSFKVGSINLTNSVTDFSDMSLILPFSAHITRLKGSVKGISSAKNATTKIAFAGKVHDLAPVNINGKITPHTGNSEFELDFNNMPLPLMTPYMADFAGRKIEKGNMSLGLKYKIQNKKLEASNNLLIDQLTLGEKVENPEAVSLPLELAIALLEDSDKKITLDVPITGSLEDPEFSIASIVIDALVNVITKIVTSPFNAIASLVGDAEDISKISFAAGQTSLSAQEQEKLDGIVTALSSRPGLKLEIKGTAFSKQDWPALQKEALKKQLKNLAAKKLSEGEDKPVDIEALKLSDDEYKDLLADLFIEKFPQIGERSLFGTPQLLEPEKGDFFEVAEAKLSATIPPDPQRLQKLATARAKAIAQHLIDKEISTERVYLLDVDIDPEDADDKIASMLGLAVN